MDRGRKRIAAVLAIDMAGYSARAETDAASAASAVASLHERVRAATSVHEGRVFSTAGDGLMCEFAAASEAVAAASDILSNAPADAPPARIGVHLGEVFEHEGGDLLGHGVNIAARLEQLAAPGTALISRAAADVVQGDLRDKLVRQGQVALDKLNESVEAFVLDPAAKPGRARRPRRKRALLIVGALAAVAVVVAGGAALWSAGVIGPSQEQRLQAALRDPEVTRALILQLAGDGEIPRDNTLLAISALQGSTTAEDQRAFALLRRGETDGAVRTLEDYAAMQLRQGRTEDAALVYTRAADLALLLTPERSLALSRRALAAAPNSLAAFERVANATRMVEGADAALAFCMRAAEDADGPTAVFARLQAALSLVFLGRYDEADTLLEAVAPDVARFPDLLLLQATDANFRANVALGTDDLREARRQVARIRGVARRMPGEEFRGDVIEATTLFHIGDYEGGWAAVNASIATRQTNGWPVSQGLLYYACLLGTPAESASPARLEAAAPYCRAAGSSQTDPILAAQTRVWFALSEGRLDDARTEIESIGLLPQTTAQPVDAVLHATMLAELALRNGDYVNADRHFAEVERIGATIELGNASRAETYRSRGVIEIQRGRRAQGCAHLVEAARLYSGAGADPGAEAVTRFMRVNNCPAPA